MHSARRVSRVLLSRRAAAQLGLARTCTTATTWFLRNSEICVRMLQSTSCTASGVHRQGHTLSAGRKAGDVRVGEVGDAQIPFHQITASCCMQHHMHACGAACPTSWPGATRSAPRAHMLAPLQLVVAMLAVWCTFMRSRTAGHPCVSGVQHRMLHATSRHVSVRARAPHLHGLGHQPHEVCDGLLWQATLRLQHLQHAALKASQVPAGSDPRVRRRVPGTGARRGKSAGKLASERLISMAAASLPCLALTWIALPCLALPGGMSSAVHTMQGACLIRQDWCAPHCTAPLTQP